MTFSSSLANSFCEKYLLDMDNSYSGNTCLPVLCVRNTYKLSFLAPVCTTDDDLCIVIETFGDQ